MHWRIAMRHTGACCVVLLSGIGIVAAAPPGEVTGVQVGSSSQISWTTIAGAADYNVYRGLVSWLGRGDGAECHGDEIAATSFPSAANPPAGEAYFYLVTAESSSGEEGTAGTGTGGSGRPLRGSCDAIVRHHVLERVGYGGDEWTRGRIAALGNQGYLNEQLDPASIDETTNNELINRRASLVPPDNANELLALDIVNAVYARRQLEQQVTMFWDNHFNTDHHESFDYFNFYSALFPATQNLESAALHYEAQNQFRDLAFNGTFREIVEASGLGRAMIIYLDTISNIATAPNENYPRELLELHTMGVDGGYTQQDIVQLAKVFTGWNICKKDASVAADPLAACIPSNTYGTATEPPGLWVVNFRTSRHDTTQKTLFAGTPYQRIIPSTAGNPAAGIADAQLAFDAIVAHPSTPRFIAKKLLQRFVDEQPTQTMIDAVVLAWNNPANPHGIGDLREVLRAVLAQAAFRDPDRAGSKIKSPFEQVVSALRAVRGMTDGQSSVRNYVNRMSELFHQNPVPTGFPEIGADWLDTNNLLERQNFGFDMATRTATSFGADVIGLLNAAGVSTAPTPNNAPAIVDYLAGVLYGGALTASERQRAIDFLNTNDSGVVSNYTDTRIRETAGFMMGFAQFLEQ
ncbi:MAG TPA: DUF1800 domain-containing protein [Candidatus Polarisedimenticolia bacterium]|nr:DUF1800 domain-containing protein [Candidatus Polarisedimenticolia bacterium]